VAGNDILLVDRVNLEVVEPTVLEFVLNVANFGIVNFVLELPEPTSGGGIFRCRHGGGMQGGLVGTRRDSRTDFDVY
jgi:hypothetical protein